MPTCTSTATASRRPSSAGNAGPTRPSASSNTRRSPAQTTHPTTTARAASPTRTPRGVGAAACIAVALLAGGGVKLWLDHRVPSPDADAGRLSRYMASPAFASLPDAQKAPYLDSFQRASDRGELTPEQQCGVLSNVRKNPI